MRFHHRPAAALLLAGALLLSGCDLPAINELRPAPMTSKSPGPRTTGKHRYSWVGSLPAGDRRPDPVGAVYAALADGDCDSVAAGLADASGNLPFWRMLDSPQHVLLYRAAVYFCAGTPSAGSGCSCGPATPMAAGRD